MKVSRIIIVMFLLFSCVHTGNNQNKKQKNVTNLFLDNNSVQDTQSIIHAKNSIIIDNTNLFPWAMIHDNARYGMWLTSFVKGELGFLHFNGQYETVLQLNSWVGLTDMIAIPNTTQLVLLNSDSGYSQKSSFTTIGSLASVSVVDILLQEEIQSFNLHTLDTLDRVHFLYDIYRSVSGDIYITDSYTALVYRIDKDLKNAEIFLDLDTQYNMSGVGNIITAITEMFDYIIIGYAITGQLLAIHKQTKALHILNNFNETLVHIQAIQRITDTNFLEKQYSQTKQHMQYFLVSTIMSNDGLHIVGIAYDENNIPYSADVIQSTYTDTLQYPSDILFIQGRLYTLNNNLYAVYKKEDSLQSLLWNIPASALFTNSIKNYNIQW